MKKRILLVEDEPGNIDVMRLELEALGYEVTVATNGREAVEMATAKPPDLIVMDILLPKSSGLEAASRIRNNPKTQVIPILAATAKTLPGHREECLKTGCNDYLPKPFTLKELGLLLGSY